MCFPLRIFEGFLGISQLFFLFSQTQTIAFVGALQDFISNSVFADGQFAGRFQLGVGAGFLFITNGLH